MAYLIRSAEPLGRHEIFESTHRVSPLLHSTVVLLQMILGVTVGPMSDFFSRFRLNGSRVGVMSNSRNMGRDSATNGLGWPKKLGLITILATPDSAAPMLAQHLSQSRRQFGFPLPYGFMGKHHTVV